jgi:hypothetical protein
MERGLRIPVFFYCLKGLGSPAGAERLRLLTAMYEHGWLVFHRLSLYSSLGNHMVAEAVGLVFKIGGNCPEGCTNCDQHQFQVGG